MANKFLSDIELEAGLVDGSNSTGTPGYLLSSTGTATSWVDPAAVSVGESEQVHIACKNTSGVAISKGDPVYITGTVGNSFIIEIAKADASVPIKMPAVGLAETDLGLNDEGFVIVSGILKNLTTDPLSTGDGPPAPNNTVYVKAGGGLTRTKPTGRGNLIQNVGKVGRISSANAGSLAVSTIMRTNDVPNLTTGKIWVGSPTYTTESTVVHLDETNGRMGIGTTSPNYKLDVDDTIGVGNSLIVNHAPGIYPRVFPPTVPGGFFETEPTGRVGVVNNQDSGEWAFSAVSVADGANFTNRSGLLHSNVNAYRLVLANTTEENIRLNSDGDSFIKGKLAIGHDTPTEDLDVDGVVKVSDGVKTNHISVNSGSRIQLNQAVFYNTGNICNEPYTDIGATLHLRTNAPLADQSVIAITRGGQGTSFPSGITQDSNGNYQFLLRDQNNNQRIRFVANDLSSGDSIIDSRRIVLCGNAFNQNGSISIDGRKWSSGTRNAVMTFTKSGTQADNALLFFVNGFTRGSISYSDTGTAYNVTSDYRLKENVIEITDGIERLKQLKPSRFNFISHADKVVDGFIAHEVQDIVPEAVTGEKDATEEYEVTPAEYDDYGNLVSEAVIGTRDAYQQIDQAKIVPLLTAALQEAVAKIETLEQEIQILKGNNG